MEMGNDDEASSLGAVSAGYLQHVKRGCSGGREGYWASRHERLREEYQGSKNVQRTGNDCPWSNRPIRIDGVHAHGPRRGFAQAKRSGNTTESALYRRQPRHHEPDGSARAGCRLVRAVTILI